MKKRLLEIISESGCASGEAERIADRLIENGVTMLPCRVGDTVYVVKYCSCHNTEPLQTGICHQKATAKRPKIYGYAMLQKERRLLGSDCDGEDGLCGGSFLIDIRGTICYKILQKEFNIEMLTKVGKTVFSSKREATEAILKYSKNRSVRWIFLEEETAIEIQERSKKQ